MKNILVPLANGFEEIEAITIIDILRRAGALVTTAGLIKKNVIGSHHVKILADTVLDDVLENDWDMIVLPGGIPGAPTLAQDNRIIKLIKESEAKRRYTAAICAAPTVLERAGVTEGKRVTSHPGSENEIKLGLYTSNSVEQDGLMITGQAAGSAMKFAFKLVEELFGKEKVLEINKGVLADL